jgi:hypothetical protein
MEYEKVEEEAERIFRIVRLISRMDELNTKQKMDLNF